MSTFDRAIVTLPTDAPTGKTGRGDNVWVVAEAGRTHGAFGGWIGVIGPGSGPPWHVHSREAEMFYVIEGTFRFWCGSEAFTIGAGGTIVLPPGVPHRFRNIGAVPSRLLGMVSPGGFERNFLDLAQMSEITPAAMAALDTQLGVMNVPAPPDAQPD